MESEQKHAAFDEFIRCSFYLHQSPHKCSLSNTYSLHCSRRLPQFEIHHFVIFIPQSHRHLSNFIAYQINWQNKQGPQRTEQLHPFAHFPTSIRKSLVVLRHPRFGIHSAQDALHRGNCDCDVANIGEIMISNENTFFIYF